MKSIVLFSDGTGNSAGSPHKTNVWRIYKALSRGKDVEQVAFYDDGVGTSNIPFYGLLGKVFGLGLAKNVKSIYKFACRNYSDPKDKIYGFGFSRGAFSMRVVIALIVDQGLVKPAGLGEEEFSKRVERAYLDYRRKSFRSSLFYRLYERWNKGMINHKLTEEEVVRPDIEMLGVWDTVDAYGMPIDELRRAWDYLIFPLAARDRDCPAGVKNAYHALALDEQRLSFAPILWNEAIACPPNQKIEKNKNRITQVWFPGVHADVGGGYPDDSLSYVPLNWMIKNAENHGLDFEEDLLRAYKAEMNIHGPIHDSRSGLGFTYRFEPRHIESLCRDRIPKFLENIINRFQKGNSIDTNSEQPSAEDNTVYIGTPKIHQSVFDRIAHYGDGYAPINLPQSYQVINTNGENANEIIKEQTDKSNLPRRDAQGKLWNLVAFRKSVYLLNTILISTVVIMLLLRMNFSILASTFLLGCIAGLLYAGSKVKGLTHIEALKIWSKANSEKFLKVDSHQKADENMPEISAIFENSIYDDRIVNDKILPSRVSRLNSKFATIVELLSIPVFVFAIGLFIAGVFFIFGKYPGLFAFLAPLLLIYLLINYIIGTNKKAVK